jgi:hypothetical protein
MRKLEDLLKTPIRHLAGSRIICVGKEENPDIVLSFEGDTIIFERKDKLLSAPIRNCYCFLRRRTYACPSIGGTFCLLP